MKVETNANCLKPRGYRRSDNIVPPVLTKLGNNEIVRATITRSDLINLWSRRSEADGKAFVAKRMLAELEHAEDICKKWNIIDTRLVTVIQRQNTIRRKMYEPAIEERRRLDGIFWKSIKKALPELSHLRLYIRIGQSGEFHLVTKIGFWSSLKIKLGFVHNTATNDPKLV